MNPGLWIMRAKEHHAGQIAKLYNDNFKDHILVNRGLLNDPGYIREQLQNDSMRWLVAIDPPRVWVDNDTSDVVGVAALAVCAPIGLAEIERVCVCEKKRGNGLARSLCNTLVDVAKSEDLGFVEAFARGSEPAMQQTFAKLGFTVYGVAPRFEIMYDGQQVREDFVHMGLVLKPTTLENRRTQFIDSAKVIKDAVVKNSYSK